MRLAIYFCLLNFFCFASLSSAESFYDVTVQSRGIFLKKDKVIESNYYSLGDSTIEGTVKGDVYVVGGQASISGVIHGDLFVLGGSFYITGKVLGDVIIISGQAVLDGFVGGNVTYLGGNLLLLGNNEIGGNLFSITGNACLEDVVNGNVTIIAAGVIINGVIKKNLRTFVDRLQISKDGKVLGDLRYRSLNKASVDDQAEIGGVITYTPVLLKKIENIWVFKNIDVGSQIFPIFLKFFYTFIIGCILVSFFPHKLRNALDALKRSPGRSFLYGLAVLGGLPIITLLLLVTVIGTPFALTFLALNIISFYTVIIFSILFVSNFLFRKLRAKENTILGLALGLAVYHFFLEIPVLGFFVACAATIFGFGATIVAQKKQI